MTLLQIEVLTAKMLIKVNNYKGDNKPELNINIQNNSENYTIKIDFTHKMNNYKAS